MKADGRWLMTTLSNKRPKGVWCERGDSNPHALASASPSSTRESRPNAADPGISGSAVMRLGRTETFVVALSATACKFLQER
jgi:hypothetical protein